MERLVWEYAGYCGVNPDEFTLRQLCLMADGKGKMDWNRTASLMALLVNMFRDPKKNASAVKPSDFNPYNILELKKKKPPKVPLTVLRDLWCKKEGNV